MTARSLLVLLLCLAPLGALAEGSVAVFVAGEDAEERARQMAPPGAKVYRVDEAQQRMAALDEQLPDDPERAKRKARELIDAAEKERLSEAFRAVAMAASLGVEQVPAVVLGRSAVVYGTADPGEARALLEAHDER